MAFAGGVLLGPRPRPMLVLLLLLSAADALQFVLSPPPLGHSAARHRPDLAAARHVPPRPALGRFGIGRLDLLLAAAMAEHWRRRGSSPAISVAPGVVGLALADLTVVSTTLANLPLIPFLTGGWLATDAWWLARACPTSTRPQPALRP